MPEVTFPVAALAGLLSFLSPCVLPMLPFYLCYMAGVSVKELEAGEMVARKRLVILSAGFALGVTTIFVLLGIGATAVGQVFAAWLRPLSYVAAGLLVAFGLHFLGVLRISLLYRQARLEASGDPTTLAGAYVMGLAFGFGWTPCVGPALAAILFVASGAEHVWRGGALLLVYGLAMTFPFVIAAMFSGPFLRFVAHNRHIARRAEAATGVMLILFGGLIATGSLDNIAQWLLTIFPGLATLG